jgi:hypothetical protein
MRQIIMLLIKIYNYDILCKVKKKFKRRCEQNDYQPMRTKRFEEFVVSHIGRQIFYD